MVCHGCSTCPGLILDHSFREGCNGFLPQLPQHRSSRLSRRTDFVILLPCAPTVRLLVPSALWLRSGLLCAHHQQRHTRQAACSPEMRGRYRRSRDAARALASAQQLGTLGIGSRQSGSSSLHRQQLRLFCVDFPETPVKKPHSVHSLSDASSAALTKVADADRLAFSLFEPWMGREVAVAGRRETYPTTTLCGRQSMHVLVPLGGAGQPLKLACDILAGRPAAGYRSVQCKDPCKTGAKALTWLQGTPTAPGNLFERLANGLTLSLRLTLDCSAPSTILFLYFHREPLRQQQPSQAAAERDGGALSHRPWRSRWASR